VQSSRLFSLVVRPTNFINEHIVPGHDQPKPVYDFFIRQSMRILSLSRYFVRKLALKDTPGNQLAVYLICSRVYGLLHPRYLFFIDDGDRFCLFFQPCHLVFPARQFHLVRCARRPLRRGLGGTCLGRGRRGDGQIFQ